MKNVNADLGSNTELATLVARIKGFDYDNATTDDNLALAKSLKLVAEDVIAQHEKACELTRALTDKLALAGVATELAGVLELIRPSPVKRGWFRRG